MDWTADTVAIPEQLKKYKWVLVILAVGLLLMLFPEKKRETVQVALPEEKTKTLQESLEQLLSQLEGAGTVRVLLTEAEGRQTVYQTDRNERKTGETGEIRQDTVIYTGGDRAQAGLVTRVDPPRYLGAVVLCQGADRAAVRLSIVDAVSTATGLGADKISVWKMK